jgi:pyruvate formate lyase activating enzyme
MRCEVCFRHCLLQEGQIGFCHARYAHQGEIIAKNYGQVTSLALDPIEKKPLKEFYPGSFILSVGSYGCNLRCPFCQNFEISQFDLSEESVFLSPADLVAKALELKPQGNIGLAFTYNEPLVGYEYVLDAAKLAHEKGLKTVLVTNGTASPSVLRKILPYIDAMNIDLKGFCKDFYDFVGGDWAMAKAFIEMSASSCHVELTTLIVPGHNDDIPTMEEEARWIASIDPKIPLHITRCFPRYKFHEAPTDLGQMEKLAEVAKRYLKSVYLGNI